MTNSRTFKLVTSHRATRDGNFGAVRAIDTDVVTEVVLDGTAGVHVSTHVVGCVEGRKVDRKVTSFYPGVTLEAAAAYRLRHGYTEVV